MRVLWILPGGLDRTGVEASIPVFLWLMERVAREHELTIALLHQYPEPCEYELHGCQIVNLGLGLQAWPGRVKHRCRQLEALADRRGKPALVHGWWLGESSRLAGILARRWGVPVVASLGGTEPVSSPEALRDVPRWWVQKQRMRRTLRSSDAITAGSRFGIDALGAVAARWLPLGVDSRLFEVATRHLDSSTLRLVHIADVNPVKDRSTLFEAVARIRREEPALRLEWAGFDTTGGEVVEEIERCGLGGVVRFHGRLEHSEVRRLIVGAHLMIQSSCYESQGVAVLEAAMAGVPCVGTEVGILAELAPEAGWAVPVRDHAALAAATVALWRDSSRRHRLGEAARRWAQAHDADWTAKTYLALYRDLISGATAA